jgi:ribosomal protein S7
MIINLHQVEYIINVYINHLDCCKPYGLNRRSLSNTSINNIGLFLNGKKKQLTEQIVSQAVEKIVAEKQIHDGIDIAMDCMHDNTPAKERRVRYGPSL